MALVINLNDKPSLPSVECHDYVQQTSNESSFFLVSIPTPHIPQFEFKDGYQQPMPLLTNYLAKPLRMLELLRLKPSRVQSRLPTIKKSWTNSICCGMTTFTSTIGQILFQFQVSICHLGGIPFLWSWGPLCTPQQLAHLFASYLGGLIFYLKIE